MGELLALSLVPFVVEEHYDKNEVVIQMRDGVRLHTVLYSPKDRSRPVPILLVRTPYGSGPYGAANYRATTKMAPAVEFLQAGYIFVFQDVRGTYKSGGEWVSLRPIRSGAAQIDESTDAYDTIDWLVHNVTGNNGRVGQWGISYPGWHTVMAMIGAHPALKAVSPQATTFDAFIGDDDHRNGAFDLTGAEWWYRMSVFTGPEHELRADTPLPSIVYSDPWSYQFFLDSGPTHLLSENVFHGRLSSTWRDLVEHPDYDDYWASRNVGRHLTDVKIPVLNVMGWFDPYDPYGAMATYQAIETLNIENLSTIVAGPWNHGGWLDTDGASDGDVEFGANTSDYYQRHLIFPFFEHHLKDKGDWQPAEAIMFETGRNRWRHFDHWPPIGLQPKNLYLHAGGRLTFQHPDGTVEACDSYLSDPARPVPYTSMIASGADEQTFMVADQRFAYSRPDVLSYQTEALSEDLTIAGPIPVNLFASTSGTDSDWVVKLIDVYPPNASDDAAAQKMAHYQMMLGSNVMRGKYRDNFSEPRPMVPEKITPICFEIPDKFHTFRKGHRIMVQVQSSWFPRIDRNPQVFTNIYKATATEYRAANQKIHRSAAAPSHLVLPVLRDQ